MSHASSPSSGMLNRKLRKVFLSCVHPVIQILQNFTIRCIYNSKRHQGAMWQGPIFPLRVDIDQYVPLHLLHVSPQCRHIAAKQSAHIARIHPDTFWSLLCECIAHIHVAAYQGACSEYAYAVWYAVISRSAQNHSYYAIYWIRRWRLFPPPCNVKMGLS